MDTDCVIEGDCLDVMGRMHSKSIDLVCTDPPYNTGLQIGAYNDYRDDYVEWMAERMAECHRVLKDTGSIYVQLDWHKIHYVKVEMDKIFGESNFQNEIIWCYTRPRASDNRYNRVHNTILFYTKSDEYTFNTPRQPYAEASMKNVGRKDKVPKRGVWKFKKSGWTIRRHPEGQVMKDYWLDIGCSVKSKYPTQKPPRLFERMIEASSMPDDIVLDPFMGSGTTCVAAHGLGRHYIGIDENPKAVEVAKERLKQSRLQ